jgi:hypothetical protein
MTITLSALQKQRRDTAANWTAENPTLLAGELGLESDTGYWKVGDGSTAWTSLAYVSGLGGEIPVSRLADGAAGQIIQTDAAGTGVEWSSTTNLPLGTAAAPAYRFQGDPNTGIYSPGADQVAVATNGSGRLFVDASGRVGVGTSSPSTLLHAAGTVRVGANDASDAVLEIGAGATGNRNAYIDFTGDTTYSDYGLRIQRLNTGANAISALEHRGTGSLLLNAADAGSIAFNVNASERARIDSSGRLLVGTTTGTSRLSIAGTADNANSEIQITATGIASGYIGANSNGLNIGTDTAGLVFKTGVTGGGSVGASGTERMRITNGGVVLVGKTVDDVNTQGARIDVLGVGSFCRDGSIPLFVNRNTDDGGLVVFRQAGTDEGNISVSGTTVSYNGAHLSRWSQLPSGSERAEILRGSVLSNIDEMCEWGNEDNEQLNRMKVSDVEGDKNVSGVFQSWDDDDDTYTDDFYCAMTGDFIIRIAEGVTVERGDLLMSAGDGTAKPQDDDIIRSKTIAKVTSTNVSCTYPDGSYCVPCVLMAC